LVGVQTLVWQTQDKSFPPSQNLFLKHYIVFFGKNRISRHDKIEEIRFWGKIGFLEMEQQ
jgi:hypothetical protein